MVLPRFDPGLRPKSSTGIGSALVRFLFLPDSIRTRVPVGDATLGTVIQKTLDELSALLGGRVHGDGSCKITGIAGLTDAGEGDVSYLLSEKYLGQLEDSKAAAFIVPESMEPPRFNCVRVGQVPEAVEGAKRIFRPPVTVPEGIHPSVLVAEDAEIGQNVTFMANVVIQPGVKIGARTTLYPGVYVGHGSKLGEDCVIYPNAVIREQVVVGDKAIIHAGAVIGADGFGFVAGEIPHRKIAQVGQVILGDNVEVGANTTIDRATLGSTVVADGSKIDNLVQIAHNVVISPDCLISSQTGIAGSSQIGRNVILGGQVGVGDHVKVGDGVIVAAKSGVTKSVDSGQILYGNPAGSRLEKQRESVSIRKLPQVVKKVKDLAKRLATLEAMQGIVVDPENENAADLSVDVSIESETLKNKPNDSGQSP